MSYLALDLGTVRTGVAWSGSGMNVLPREAINVKQLGGARLVDAIIDLIKEYDVHTLVVGAPLTAHDEPTKQQEFVERVMGELAERITAEKFDTKIVQENEYGSTVEAEAMGGSDSDAAAIILQHYLDTHGTELIHLAPDELDELSAINTKRRRR